MAISRARAFGAPGKYIQGPGEYENLETFASSYGDNTFYLIDSFLFDEIAARIQKIYASTASKYVTEPFRGECSYAEIERVTERVRTAGATVVVAMGGGKTLDTGKMVAMAMNIPLIIAPTSASTDAPCSAMSVIYTDDHQYIGCVFHKRNPDLVLVDTEMIAKAPLRMFRAGMGDALSTYYEALANERTDGVNYVGSGYRRTRASVAMAELAREILLEDGAKALRALACGAITEAVENVIEANILLGAQFENAGSSVAHAVHGALTALPATHKYLHGEKVAFGIVVQLVLENYPEAELAEAVKWLISLDLPVTLDQLDVEASEANISLLAEALAGEKSRARAVPMWITRRLLHDAIKAADRTGRDFRENFQGRAWPRGSEYGK
ncbi:MAG: glycerol dehydrogenase [Planctomycetota bacterium]|jgi:glycerol dehydrogenase|nr:glycerol dehydrogenase [Planctomycetota bacterium]